MLSRKDGQNELIELVCARFRAGEGVDGTFFGRPNTYLFIGDHKYWLMTHWDAVALDDGQNYVLNRAHLYRDRRDFVIQTGDTGKREGKRSRPWVMRDDGWLVRLGLARGQQRRSGLVAP